MIFRSSSAEDWARRAFIEKETMTRGKSAGRQLVRVNPRGTSREYRYGELDRDYNAALNILERGLAGSGRPFAPAEIKPLLVAIPASLIVEAGRPIPSR